MTTLRRARGASVVIAIALAFAFTVLGLGLFLLAMYFGGERETKNAADAGALNIGRQAATYNVQLQGGDEQQFTDVCEGQGAPAQGGTNVNLRDINRVWGKALLCALNAHSMGEGQDDSQKLHDAATTISDRLTNALDDPNNLKPFYLQFAQANSTRMLGQKSYLDAPDLSSWSHSYKDRDSESNIQINAAQLPLQNDIAITMVQNGKDPNHNYLAGYHAYNVDSLDYWQVPYRLGERPHLVSRSQFDSDAQNPPPWQTQPVPNAFSALGSTQNNEHLGEATTSWVQSNPQQSYPLAIPNGYIKIKIDANTLDWRPNGIPYYTDSYGFVPDEFTADPFPLPCGSLSADEFVGLEYLPAPTLFRAIFALPPIPPMPSQAMDNLFQRLQELHPGYSKAAFLSTLASTAISPDASDQEFAIYNSSFDVTNSNVLITPLSAAPSWVNSDPDGSQSELVQDREYQLGPNWGTTNLACYGDWYYPLLTEVTGTRQWTPGTGYGGCLGTLEIHRTTIVTYFGDCSCP